MYTILGAFAKCHVSRHFSRVVGEVVSGGFNVVFRHLFLKKTLLENSFPHSTYAKNLTVNMPPKRKAAVTKTEVEPEPVRSKRTRKPVLAAESNGVNHENVQQRNPVKKPKSKKGTIAEENKETESEKPSKPKKATKPKAPPKKPASKSKSPEPGLSHIPDPESESHQAKAKPKGRKPKAEPKPKKNTKKPDPEKKQEVNTNENVETVENGEPKAKKTKTAKETKAEATANGEIEKEPKGRKAKVAKEEKEPKEEKEKVLLNKTSTDWSSIDFSCNKKNGYEVKHNMIISTWNVGGMKSWVKKGCLEYLKHEKPDVLCIQETKCNEEKLPEELKELKLYNQYWCSSEKEGYAGVGLLSIKVPKKVTYGVNNAEQDVDGRCITAEYDEFFLVNVYVPNSGRKLVTLPKRLEWNKIFKDYIISLDKIKPVIVCGDLNVSHNEIDLARPASNTKNAGFTPEEREDMTDLLKTGFVDVYRQLYPDDEGVYSFWTYMANARAKNVGWRLDYFLVSSRIMKGVCDAAYRTGVLGSDHCPMTLFINI